MNATMVEPVIAKETTSSTVELDSENYGAPPENSGIEINAEKASNTQPQAWEDEHGNWFYNFAGALRLAEVLRRTLPSIDQLFTAVNANPGAFGQYAGYRNGNDGKHYEREQFSRFWSASDLGARHAQYVCLKNHTSSAKKYKSRQSYGYSVRFIVDKK